MHLKLVAKPSNPEPTSQADVERLASIILAHIRRRARIDDPWVAMSQSKAKRVTGCDNGYYVHCAIASLVSSGRLRKRPGRGRIPNSYAPAPPLIVNVIDGGRSDA